MERSERLLKSAQRIVDSYKETGFDPADSTDHAVILAVNYLATSDTVDRFCDDLLRAYSQRDDAQFDKALAAIKEFKLAH